jgi:hypothetical protein
VLAASNAEASSAMVNYYVQIGIRSIGQCQMQGATSGEIYGLAVRG